MAPARHSWHNSGCTRTISCLAMPSPSPVQIIKNVRIPMPDGVQLAADLFMPEGPGPFPAVLEYIPYRKDDITVPSHYEHHYFAQHGYVGVRLDVRGTGGSSGIAENEYVLQEQLD